MFKIKSSSKAELAMLYFPDSDPHVGEPPDEMDLRLQTADGRPQQDRLQKTGKISVGTTGQNGRGTSGGTVIRVLNFEF